MLRRTTLAPWFVLAGLAVTQAGCGDAEQVSYGVCPVPLGDSPQRGPKDAWVTIVEFADFQCRYCQVAESTIAEVDAQRPGVRWVFKQFPIASLHKNAETAASAADCAHQQGKFWEMHDRMFAVALLPLDGASVTAYAEALGLDMGTWKSCFLSSESRMRVLTDYQQGLSYGVEGTPTFFINGHMLPGAYPAKDFLALIDEAQSDAKKRGIARADYYDVLVDQGCSN
jgi:protein-disulfide isomerase